MEGTEAPGHSFVLKAEEMSMGIMDEELEYGAMSLSLLLMMNSESSFLNDYEIDEDLFLSCDGLCSSANYDNWSLDPLTNEPSHYNPTCIRANNFKECGKHILPYSSPLPLNEDPATQHSSEPNLPHPLSLSPEAGISSPNPLNEELATRTSSAEDVSSSHLVSLSLEARISSPLSLSKDPATQHSPKDVPGLHPLSPSSEAGISSPNPLNEELATRPSSTEDVPGSQLISLSLEAGISSPLSLNKDPATQHSLEDVPGLHPLSRSSKASISSPNPLNEELATRPSSAKDVPSLHLVSSSVEAGISSPLPLDKDRATQHSPEDVPDLHPLSLPLEVGIFNEKQLEREKSKQRSSMDEESWRSKPLHDGSKNMSLDYASKWPHLHSFLEGSLTSKSIVRSKNGYESSKASFNYTHYKKSSGFLASDKKRKFATSDRLNTRIDHHTSQSFRFSSKGFKKVGFLKASSSSDDDKATTTSKELSAKNLVSKRKRQKLSENLDFVRAPVPNINKEQELSMRIMDKELAYGAICQYKLGESMQSLRLLLNDNEKDGDLYLSGDDLCPSASHDKCSLDPLTNEPSHYNPTCVRATKFKEYGKHIRPNSSPLPLNADLATQHLSKNMPVLHPLSPSPEGNICGSSFLSEYEIDGDFFISCDEMCPSANHDNWSLDPLTNESSHYNPTCIRANNFKEYGKKILPISSPLPLNKDLATQDTPKDMLDLHPLSPSIEACIFSPNLLNGGLGTHLSSKDVLGLYPLSMSLEVGISRPLPLNKELSTHRRLRLVCTHLACL